MLIGMATYREVFTVDWSERMTLPVVFKAGIANLMSPATGLPVIVKTKDCVKSKASKMAVLDVICLFLGLFIFSCL